jgi:Gram-negative bacterial TonB protein C-terminal
MSVAACFTGGLASHPSVVTLLGAATPALSSPEDGAVVDEAFTSEYFGLSYPLIAGWTVGASSPPPSQFGDYVLTTLVPEGKLTGNIVITAQDMFFAGQQYKDAAAMAGYFRRTMSEVAGMTIDREPSEERIAGRVLHRVDFSGVGLFRAMFVTELRCHLVSFNLTARDPGLLADLARSLNNLSFAVASKVVAPDPVCMKDYAVAETLLRKVQPLPTGPAFTSIPVRIVISTDGDVRQVHVIRATPDQRSSIENALHQWKFKPYALNGRPVEVETGISFQFTPR